MNGAIAVPWVKIVAPPNKNNVNKVGNNQNFFLVKMNLKNSKKNFITV
tara:strand:+ start:691 stop:834 length:144 start_codon:yes stop_codon:yes gene_type:complete